MDERYDVRKIREAAQEVLLSKDPRWEGFFSRSPGSRMVAEDLDSCTRLLIEQARKVSSLLSRDAKILLDQVFSRRKLEPTSYFCAALPYIELLNCTSESCIRSTTLWLNCFTRSAKQRGWSFGEMLAPQPPPFRGLLELAFQDFVQRLGFDLRKKEERRKEHLAQFLCEKVCGNLLSSQSLRRVACSLCGGWLLVHGPEQLRKDGRYFCEVLHDCPDNDLSFLDRLDEDATKAFKEELSSYAGFILGRCSVSFAVSMIYGDPSLLLLDFERFSREIRESACLAWLMAERLFAALVAESSAEQLSSCLQEVSRRLLYQQSWVSVGSKVRQAFCSFSRAAHARLKDPATSEEVLLLAAGKLLRLTGPRGTEEPLPPHRRPSSERPAAAEDGAEATHALQQQQRDAGADEEEIRQREETRKRLEVEIHVANEAARAQKLARAKLPSQAKRRIPGRTQGRSGRKCLEEAEDEGPAEYDDGQASSVPAREKCARPQQEGPSLCLLSTLPLEEEPPPACEKKGRADRKKRQRESWLRKKEEQLQKLREVFGSEEAP